MSVFVQDQAELRTAFGQRDVLNSALLADERAAATTSLGENNEVCMFRFSFHKLNASVRFPHLHRLLEQAQLLV